MSSVWHSKVFLNTSYGFSAWFWVAYIFEVLYLRNYANVLIWAPWHKCVLSSDENMHGCWKKFFQGVTSTFCSSFSGLYRCNANGHSQNPFPFLRVVAIDVARGSKGDMVPPKFLVYFAVLNIDSIFCSFVKYCCSLKVKIFAPPIFRLSTQLAATNWYFRDWAKRL